MKKLKPVPPRRWDKCPTYEVGQGAKLCLLIFMLGFLISGCGIGREYRILGQGEKIKIAPPIKKLSVGERLTYTAEWMGLNVGTMTLSIKDIIDMNGRQVYHIVATIDSVSVISKIYKVKDEISTYLDVEKLYPVRFEKKQREGGYMADEYTDFDQEKGKAIYFSKISKEKKEFDIPKKAQDPLSSLYYFRLQELNGNKSIFANISMDEKNYLLEAKIRKKGLVNIEGVGEWEAFMVEPLPWFQGKITRKAKATIWFSADEKRIPLVVTTISIPLVGTITITLQKAEFLDTPGQ